MAFDRKQRSTVRQRTDSGARFTTGTLDATTTEEIVKLGVVASKVSYQSSGTLAGNISFSINGSVFFDSGAYAATVPGSYNTHNVTAVKVTRTGGSGKMSISAK